MPKVELHDTTAPATEQPRQVSQVAGSLLMSLAFWITLVVAALMYAGVSLSPKLADWMQAREQLTSNAYRLQQLENEADYLERIAGALKKDPQFAERLIQLSQSPASEAAMLDSEMIAAQLRPETKSDAKKSDTGWLANPRVHSAVIRLASDLDLRRWLLIASAVSTVFAFTLFNDSGVKFAIAAFAWIRAAVGFLFSRYRKTPITEPSPAMPGTDGD
jgi:hypothetical protein